ncbi:hypothetical protein EDM22_03945 [Agromyces tardus]|uniref:Uncharacterized protein n=1 Tax=Agromyces tardus TaxID=2583849 RepID=A0A3M8AK52_9MICO|nr:hypothetical protein EDM22_03945 [Agromyces tardus]
MLRIKGRDAGAVADDPDCLESLSVNFRGGVYLIGVEDLKELPVVKNNRAILIDTPVVQRLLSTTHAAGAFSPLPLWYWLYSSDRPPDMYSAQRSEYDTRFHARGAVEES